MRQKQIIEKQIRKLKKQMVLLLFSMFMVSTVFAQERVVTGLVTDLSGATLPGVNIILKGTQAGTVTDVNGKFSIKITGNDAKLLVSYIGYENQEVKITDQTDYTVKLAESVKELNEVVVVGYGVQKKSDLTGAIASVSGDKLAEIPIAGIDQALQGRAAGVNIIPKTGRPGSGVDIQIRGITSINGSSPLIIIDGVASGTSDAGALTRLNPNDIQSIEVLKDASSAAIYGASGGNGVILVTTKQGKAGKIQTNFNAYRGIESVINKVDLMNSQQWLEFLEEKNPNKVGGILVPYTYRPDTFKTYDWQDMMFKEAITDNYDLSFSGGSDRSSFMVSSSYNKQNGILKSSENERLTIRVNSDYKITEHIKFDEKISYTNTVNSGFEDWEWQNYYSNPVKDILNMQPYLPAYNPNYKPAWDDSARWSSGGNRNPNTALDMKNRKKRNNDFEGNFGLSLEIIKGLVFTTRYDGKLGFFDDKEFKKKYYSSATDINTENELNQAMRRDISWNFQNLLTYNFSLMDAHNFTMVAGSEASRWYWYDVSGLRVGMPSTEPNMLYLSKSTNNVLERQIITGTGEEGRSYRYIGRLNYDYKSKYLFTFNISRDYASNFAPNNRVGNFPSLSVGWKFTEEEFMKNQSLISFGKLRFGWGETGANLFPGNPYASLIYSPLTYKYSFNNQSSMVGAGPVQVANPDLKWESVSMINLGLDLGLIKNMVYLSVEYFEKTNDGMIMKRELSLTNGTKSEGTKFDLAETNPYMNIGSIKNRGFEFSLEAKKKDGEVTGSFDLNLGIVRNEVMSLATDSLLNGGVHDVSPITMTMVGGAVSEFWGYKTDGIYRESDPTRTIVTNGKASSVITDQPFYMKPNATGGQDTVFNNAKLQAGDVRYIDLNGDGIVDDKDKVSLGSPLPKFTMGFSFNLAYKIFDMNANFYCSYGNKIFNGTKQYLYASNDNGNRAAGFANRYRNEIVKDGLVVVRANKDTDVPRLEKVNYSRTTEFYIEDGSYLRLQNIQIGVSVPKSIIEKFKIEKFRVYVGAKNLFTLTKYTGFSPDVSSGQNGVKGLALGIDNGVYPATRMFLFGINLQF